MPSLDDIAPNFARAQQRWPDAPLLVQYYKSLRSCYEENSHGLVEHVKSFLESVCLTILEEFKVSKPSENPNTTELLGAALAPLGIRNSRGTNKLDKVLSGFNKLTDAISDMRNESGPLAHGKDGYLDPISSDHARAFLHAGDVVLGLILNVEEGKEPDLVATREPYERFKHLNSRIDNAVSLEARTEEDGERSLLVISVLTGPKDPPFELRVEASALLYGIDREAYVEVLKTIRPPSVGQEESTTIVAPEHPSTSVTPSSTVDPIPIFIEKYTGPLEPIRHEIERFFENGSIRAKLKHKGNFRFIDSILATIEKYETLDWVSLGGAQAKLKIALKRLMLGFEIRPDWAGLAASQLTDLLRHREPGSATAKSVGSESSKDTQS